MQSNNSNITEISLDGFQVVRYKKIECSKFTHQLYDFWNWNKDFHYRANGKLVKSGPKIMLYFDFTKPEEWEGSKLVSDFGG